MTGSELIGNLIVAPPCIKGSFWYKTVILVTEHNSRSSVGLVINKPSNYTIRELGKQLGLNIDLPGYVYIGGPVSPKSLSVIHSNEWSCKNTMRINHELSISSADDILPRFAQGDLPLNWRLFVGMSTWAAGQLEKEILGQPPYELNSSWCLAISTQELIYDYDGRDQWIAAINQSSKYFAVQVLTKLNIEGYV